MTIIPKAEMDEFKPSAKSVKRLSKVKKSANKRIAKLFET